MCPVSGDRRKTLLNPALFAKERRSRPALVAIPALVNRSRFRRGRGSAFTPAKALKEWGIWASGEEKPSR
jgi:hypothetical protein